MIFSFFLVLSTLFLGKAADCLWDDSKKEIINSVIRPFSSCRDYCSEIYPHTPQKAYYNVTSQNCEPIRRCISSVDIYDYDKNKCFSN